MSMTKPEIRSLSPWVLLAVAFCCLQPSRLSAQPAAAPKAAEEALPPADEIIDRYVEAIGGAEVLRQYKSFALTGHVVVPQLDLEGAYVASFAAPNKFHSDYSVPGFSERIEGFDGEVGWRLEGGVHPRIVEGRELKEMLLLADFDADLNYRRNYTVRETVGREEFAGADCYEVRLVTDFQEEYIHYFETDSGLLKGKKSWVGSPDDGFEVTEILLDYRRVGGRLFPMVIKQQFTGIEQVITLSEVTFGEVEEDAFKLPESVAKLLKDDSEGAP